jgi:predicted transcriptional regulator of viral defense system
MNYLELKSKFFGLGCFSIHQVYAWSPGFDRNNFVRWNRKGLLIRLRQGYYAFPEYRNMPGFGYYFANRIYQPSYISLQMALSFYGMIPEAVVQYSSVSSLKTMSFSNPIGEFSYMKMQDKLIFGYELKMLQEGISFKLACPEKALLDLLYLYPFYNTRQEIEELRFDEDFMQGQLDWQKLLEYSVRFKNKALDQRIKLLRLCYSV